jgi:hypothetical protein
MFFFIPLREDGNFKTDNLTEYIEKCFMGRKSKRRPQNSSVSSPHANMSNTPPPSMSNLTYAVQNANETLYGPPHVIPPIVRLSVSKFPSSRKFSAPTVVKHTNKTTTDQSYKTGDHSYPPCSFFHTTTNIT